MSEVNKNLPPAFIVAKEGCPFCTKAERLLEENGYEYDRISGLGKSALSAISGNSTYPQVFIGGKLIGGSDDLEEYLKEKK